MEVIGFCSCPHYFQVGILFRKDCSMIGFKHQCQRQRGLVWTYLSGFSFIASVWLENMSEYFSLDITRLLKFKLVSFEEQIVPLDKHLSIFLDERELWIPTNNASWSFCRLTPTYMFVLLFFDQMAGFLGEGPMWYGLQAESPCNKYWWTNLLYINNFYPTSMNDEVRIIII